MFDLYFHVLDVDQMLLRLLAGTGRGHRLPQDRRSRAAAVAAAARSIFSVDVRQGGRRRLPERSDLLDCLQLVVLGLAPAATAIVVQRQGCGAERRAIDLDD